MRGSFGFFIFLFCSAAFSSAVCTVESAVGCDELSREIAFQFRCDDSRNPNCETLLQNQFSLIAPTNYPNKNAVFSSFSTAYSRCDKGRCRAL